MLTLNVLKADVKDLAVRSCAHYERTNDMMLRRKRWETSLFLQAFKNLLDMLTYTEVLLGTVTWE